jgi:hypothetical protein
MNDEFPQFNCQVMDAHDPNRFVHIVTLTSADFRAMNDKPDLRKEQWVKTFYEGCRMTTTSSSTPGASKPTI